MFGALLLVVLAAVAIDQGSKLLGSYSVTAENVRIDLGLFQLAFEHVALLALGLAILPFIVGVGWLVDRVRPSTAAAERAFAVVGCSTLVLVTLQVASFNQRFGAGLVKDRYLFYVVPVVLLGLAGAVVSRQWPRWWALVVPAAVAAVGFASAPLALYEKLNVDSPVAILNNELLELATSTRWAHVLLVLAALVAAAGAPAREGVRALARRRRRGRRRSRRWRFRSRPSTRSTASSRSTARTACR